MSMSSLNPAISIFEDNEVSLTLLKEAYMNVFWSGRAPEIYDLLFSWKELTVEYSYELGLDEYYNNGHEMQPFNDSGLSLFIGTHKDSPELFVTVLDRNNSIYIDDCGVVRNSCQSVLFEILKEEEEDGYRGHGAPAIPMLY